MANQPEVQMLKFDAADTEYTVDVKGFNFITVKCRDTTSVVRMAFITGQVAAATELVTQKYITIQAGGVYNMNNSDVTREVDLFLASTTQDAMVEIELWK